ncbi:MAG: TVP38/TMEM64 family protein [Eubacteriales bacterium]
MEKQEWSAKKRKVLFAAALIAALLLIAALGVLVGVPLVRFASEPEHFRDWVDARGIWGRLAYMGMVLFQILIALIPGEPFEIVGGYAFGAVEGTLLCLAASTAGSILVFLLVRRFGMRLVGVFFSRDKLNSLRFLRSTPKRDFLFLLIFMLPGTPKDLLSYFAGLTDIRFPVWLLICSFGRIPSIITSIVGGDALGEGNYTYAILVFAVTLAVSGVGLFVYNQICLKHAGKTKKEDTKDPSKEN